jgi:signal transduction histidine kinase
VLENLVANAAKFSPAGGVISLGARRRGDDALFWVQDRGAGISQADLPHLFDRFWQVKKTARRGAGLGLAIVKGLIESHGGHIWVDTAVGQGSTFYFTIPAVR